MSSVARYVQDRNELLLEQQFLGRLRSGCCCQGVADGLGPVAGFGQQAAQELANETCQVFLATRMKEFLGRDPERAPGYRVALQQPREDVSRSRTHNRASHATSVRSTAGSLIDCRWRRSPTPRCIQPTRATQ